MDQNYSNISFEELQKYTNALFNQVAQLKEQISQLHAENDRLKSDQISKQAPEMTDEEWVAINEIRKLKELSQSTELSLDDTRRLDTYVKILSTIRTPKEGEEKEYADASVDNLLAALDNELKLAK